MGMRQKLEKEYQRGFEDGKKTHNEILIQAAKNIGIVQGATETWEIIEDMIPKLPGIGPKTTKKIMVAIQQYSRVEKAKLQRREEIERGEG